MEADCKDSISLIIPIYNEMMHLESFLKKVDTLQLPITKELIFIDDFSSDGTYEFLHNFPFTSKNKIFRNKQNMGKGYSLKKGIEEATGKIVGVQDADFEYDMNDLPKLITPLLENSCDVSYGSRYKKNSLQVHRTYHYLINRLLTTLSNFLSGMYLTDMETCYKLFNQDIIKNINLESNRFGFEPEITAKIARLKLRVYEQPISYFPRNYAQGKKISWKDGIAAFYHIFKFNFFANPEKDYKSTLDPKYIPENKQFI